jgi:hypothetical protein
MYEKGDSPWGFFGLSVFGALICFFVSILGAAALMIYKQFKLAMVCLLLGLIYWPFTIVVVKIAFVVFGIPHDGNAVVKPYNKKRQSVKVFRLSERYMPTIVRTGQANHSTLGAKEINAGADSRLRTPLARGKVACSD